MKRKKHRGFCVKDHDLSVVGRTKSGHCALCRAPKDICSQGHDLTLENAKYSNGKCRQCHNQRSKDRYYADPLKHNKKSIKYNRDHPWIAKTAGRKSTTGWSGPRYSAQWAVQQGRCFICDNEPDGKGPCAVLHADHDHETGMLRCLLCHKCNKTLGFVGDDITILSTMIDYVNQFKSQNIY